MLARSRAARSALRGLPTSTTRRTAPLVAPLAAHWQLQPVHRSYLAPATPPYDPRLASTDPGGPRPPTEEERPSATAEFYRALVPSMLHCLALGSIVYYALELTYMYLLREKQGDDLRAKVAALEDELAAVRAGPHDAQGGAKATRSWWKLW
ncbi:uncharacterized protein JCM10292_000496 [Rhodotorula paludigena]|uniref:uncharacterized protein n=1 Tax=Rhodotorula paludigena TaxID=86838 RepID=UPI00316FA3D2